MKALSFLVAPLLLAAAAQAQTVTPSPADRIRADVEFLASDLLEGRDTGSRGHEIAAAYVVSEFRATGLEAAGEKGGWYQQVPFRRAALSGAPKVTLNLSGRDRTLRVGVDFAAQPSLTQKERTLDAPLVFVGNGISEPRLGIDDYAGVDVRGKIAVVLQGTPEGLRSDVAAHLDSAKAETAASKGAVGFLQVSHTGPRNVDRVSYVSRPLVDWIDPAGRTRSNNALLPVAGAISKKLAEQLVASAGQNLGRLIGAAKKRSVRAFDLPARLQIRDTSVWQDFTSPQVVGMLPGTDPQLKDEFVVLMGHLDHLGIKAGAKPGEDNIHNGAIDNAGGIATMLEAARQFVASGEQPRRSVLFIAVTGEERGLRGADYFAANPTVPIDNIAGLVNLDMPLLLYDFRDVIAFGAEHSTVARAVADASRSMGIALASDPMPEQSLFTRSDHYRFVQRGVPSVFLMTGHANGGEQAWKKFLDGDYHGTKDDLTQPINWSAAARFAELNYRIARTLANSNERPLWHQGSYFGDRFAPGKHRAPAPDAR